jgi:hypothetical protein
VATQAMEIAQRLGHCASQCLAYVAVLTLLTAGARADPSSSESPANHVSDQATSEGAGRVPQITIEAQRQDTRRRVHEFVSHAPVLVNHESLARWNKPICPLVAGLPRVEGEFVLTRLSEIASSVSAPLAPSECTKYNLVIIVATDPVALLKAWAARMHYRNLFGDAPLHAIDRFLNTPRPIRVWYNDERTGANGSVQMSNGSLSAGQKPLGGGGQSVNSFTEPTRLERTEAWGIDSVIELVDSRLVTGLKFGQVADYLALAGLAQFNFDVDLGTAPTILRLFNAPEEAGALNLTSWDQAFLKALYHTRQSSVFQTERITHSMVGDLMH